MGMSNERRPAIDVARVLALAMVVAGHLVMAVIDRDPSGALRGANLLEINPGWSWVSVISPMPVFFVAAGYANAGSASHAAVGRLRTLVGLAAAVIATWSAAVVISEPFVGTGSVVGDGARLATQPLWFIAAYAPMLVTTASMTRRAASRPVAIALGCVVVVAACDLLRFAAGAPSWAGWPGFLAAWAVPWMVGEWWRGSVGSAPTAVRRREIGVGLALIAGGATLAVVLVRHAGYAASMLDVVEGARSNSTPPTLYTAAVAVAQAGVVLVAAGVLDRIGARWRSMWSRAGAASLGVYAWHLTALALCSALVAAGLPAPERFTVGWWLSRPLWWGAIIALTMVFVSITSKVLSRARPNGRGDGTSIIVADAGAPARWRIAAGTTTAATAAAAVGLHGPRTTGWAVGLSVGMTVAWGLLRDAKARAGRTSRGVGR